MPSPGPEFRAFGCSSTSVGHAGQAGVVVVGDGVREPVEVVGLDPPPDLDGVVHAPEQPEQMVDV